MPWAAHAHAAEPEVSFVAPGKPLSCCVPQFPICNTEIRGSCDKSNRGINTSQTLKHSDATGSRSALWRLSVKCGVRLFPYTNDGCVAVVLNVIDLPALDLVLFGSAVTLCAFYFTKKNGCHY